MDRQTVKQNLKDDTEYIINEVNKFHEHSDLTDPNIIEQINDAKINAFKIALAGAFNDLKSKQNG